MTFADIELLIRSETDGSQVVSWYAKHLWDDRKTHVDNDEKALRLSKILRDNQRNSMALLSNIFDEGEYVFLIYLLGLGYADRNVDFRNLRVVNYVTVYDYLIEQPRTTRYTAIQKERRVRIGFKALQKYKEKENRHAFLVAQEEVSEIVNRTIHLLKRAPKKYRLANRYLHNILFTKEETFLTTELRKFVTNFPTCEIPEFEAAKTVLIGATFEISKVMSNMWEDPRYIRDNLDTE
jgi:hypothetical protein